MKQIKFNYFPYKINLFSVFQESIDNHKNKRVKYFQARSSNTSLDHKKINNLSMGIFNQR